MIKTGYSGNVCFIFNLRLNCKCDNEYQDNKLTKYQKDCNCQCKGDSNQYCGCHSKINIYNLKSINIFNSEQN